MAYVPAPNTAMVELIYDLNSQRLENTLYFQASASLSVSLMTTLGNDIINWWLASLRPQQVAALQLTEVFVTDLTTNTSPTVSVTTGIPASGTHAGDAWPNNCALCVSFRTNNRGKSGRGRNYVAGLDEDQVTISNINPSYVAAIVAAYQSLIGAGTLTAGLQWVVVSRFGGGVARASALIQPITAVLAVDNFVDSQRRRLPGRGR